MKKSLRKSVKSRKSLRKSRKSKKSLRKSVKSKKSLRKRLRKMNDGMDRPEPETKEGTLSKIPEEIKENEINKFLGNSDKMSLSSTNRLYRENTGLDMNFDKKGSRNFIYYFNELSDIKKEEYMNYLKNFKITLKFDIVDPGEVKFLSYLFENYFNKVKSKYSENKNSDKNSLIHTLYLTQCQPGDGNFNAFGGVSNLNLSHSKKFIMNVSYLGDVHTLNLSQCTSYFEGVNELGRVYNLDLSKNIYIKDVSALGGVYDLNLSGCELIVDVSKLGGVHKLNLSYCEGIKDVSALGKVHDLNLSFSENITDVSALTRVHTLNLSGCKDIDVSALTGVTNLILNEERNLDYSRDNIDHPVKHNGRIVDILDYFDYSESDLEDEL